jgi:alpha-aminoadipate/glutamate carrier protein LysW
MINCPECAGTIAFAEAPRVSEIIECGECRNELEVLTTTPLTLALAPDVEEDWGE